MLLPYEFPHAYLLGGCCDRPGAWTDSENACLVLFTSRKSYNAVNMTWQY